MKEIERKFRVDSADYKSMAVSESHIAQWYLSSDKERTVRVRIRDDKAYLTIKGLTQGVSRDEFEYEIPLSDAQSMKEMAEGIVIEKTRWIVYFAGKRWEVDEFHGELQGLTVAEIELRSETEEFQLPPFVGIEVSADPRYYNSVLASGEIDPAILIR